MLDCNVNRRETEALKSIVATVIFVLLLSTPSSSSTQIFANEELNSGEERLVTEKFRGYNSLVRPVARHSSRPLLVEIGMALVLLINMDELNQVMQTNVWLTLHWFDYQLQWEPSEFDGVTSLHVPCSKVWLPDIVLFNNVDGHYEVSYHSNVVVRHTGLVLWVPPAIYKSSCLVDVQYFPFDQQNCSMQFGSWTYDKNEVRLGWYKNKTDVELNDYLPSGIWDVVQAPGRLSDDGARIEYRVVIRRKTLFYTVILIIPAVLMAFLSMMVFYLPAECSEKITLAISILLALVVFMVLVSKMLPPTSDTIPLMAKYLLFTFVMNIVAIVTTVAVTNVYFRNPFSSPMNPLLKQLLLVWLPPLLFMGRPTPSHDDDDDDDDNNNNTSIVCSSSSRAVLGLLTRTKDHHPNCSLLLPSEQKGDGEEEVVERVEAVRRVCDDVAFLANHFRLEEQRETQQDDWRFLAMIIDRFMLLSFLGLTSAGLLWIVVGASSSY